MATHDNSSTTVGGFEIFVYGSLYRVIYFYGIFVILVNGEC